MCKGQDKGNTSNIQRMISLGAVHKGRPQRQGRGKITCGQGGKGPCGRPQDGTFLDLFQHALQTLPMGDAY